LAKLHLGSATLTSIRSPIGQQLTAGKLYPESSPLQGFLTRYTLGNSSHQDNHILSLAPGNSSRHLCIQLPTLPSEETGHAIFAPSSHPQGLANYLALS